MVKRTADEVQSRGEIQSDHAYVRGVKETESTTKSDLQCVQVQKVKNNGNVQSRSVIQGGKCRS